MTGRIAILGNSHIAALREAWTVERARWPGLEANFLGLHGELLMQTRIDAGRLVPASDAAAEAMERISGVRAFELQRCDAIAIVGCGLASSAGVTLQAELRWPALPSLDRQADLAGMRPLLVSEGAARATLAAMLGRRLALRLARHLRRGCNLPVWLVQQPNVHAAVRRGPVPPKLRGLVRTLVNGDAPHLARLFAEVASDVAARESARFLPQPPQTVTQDLLTAAPFCTGATRLAEVPGVPQPPHDLVHANAAYGAAVLDQLASALMDQRGE
ncbi:MAG: hypothetical protein JJT81_17365 [Rubellimicrobium sp.]|nr:hypothetical protein [Rubellimicrobium sp.]